MQGARKGGALSSSLFNVVINNITQKVNSVDGGSRIGNNALKILCYADNIVSSTNLR